MRQLLSLENDLTANKDILDVAGYSSTVKRAVVPDIHHL